ncbi:hypothetical protein HAX54_019516, partial [Datura stramonium]|nr:hypothetical protein [Datura stramonium]
LHLLNANVTQMGLSWTCFSSVGHGFVSTTTDEKEVTHFADSRGKHPEKSHAPRSLQEKF